MACKIMLPGLPNTKVLPMSNRLDCCCLPRPSALPGLLVQLERLVEAVIPSCQVNRSRHAASSAGAALESSSAACTAAMACGAEREAVGAVLSGACRAWNVQPNREEWLRTQCRLTPGLPGRRTPRACAAAWAPPPANTCPRTTAAAPAVTWGKGSCVVQRSQRVKRRLGPFQPPGRTRHATAAASSPCVGGRHSPRHALTAAPGRCTAPSSNHTACCSSIPSRHARSGWASAARHASSSIAIRTTPAVQSASQKQTQPLVARAKQTSKLRAWVTSQESHEPHAPAAAWPSSCARSSS